MRRRVNTAAVYLHVPDKLQRCNALGWNKTRAFEMPIILDADHKQRDPNGIFIVPFKHTERMTREQLARWAFDNKVKMP